MKSLKHKEVLIEFCLNRTEGLVPWSPELAREIMYTIHPTLRVLIYFENFVFFLNCVYIRSISLSLTRNMDGLSIS